MKKIRSTHIFLILAILPLIMTSCNPGNNDTELDFNITVPENWEYAVLANEGWIYTAARNKVDENDSITEGLYIEKVSYPGYTLDNFYTNAYKPWLIATPDYDFLYYDTDTTINAISYKKLVSAEFQPIIQSNKIDTVYVDVTTERYLCMRNTYVYHFTFIAIDTVYSDVKQTFKNIMSSVQFKQ
jgi:hypothetical protein